MKRSTTLFSMRRLVLTPLCCLLLIQVSFAQHRITGKVSHATSGTPLTGVSVQVKEKVIGTATDANGTFSLTINDEPPFTLVVSSIGFITQEIDVQNPNIAVEVRLSEQTIFADEIVVSASRV